MFDSQRGWRPFRVKSPSFMQIDEIIDMEIFCDFFVFFDMMVVRHLGFVACVFAPPMKSDVLCEFVMNATCNIKAKDVISAFPVFYGSARALIR